jgi:hypothetical protein
MTRMAPILAVANCATTGPRSWGPNAHAPPAHAQRHERLAAIYFVPERSVVIAFQRRDERLVDAGIPATHPKPIVLPMSGWPKRRGCNWRSLLAA